VPTICARHVASCHGRDQKESQCCIVHGSRNLCPVYRIAWSCYESSCWWLKTVAPKFAWQFLRYCAASVWRYFVPSDETQLPSSWGWLWPMLGCYLSHCRVYNFLPVPNKRIHPSTNEILGLCCYGYIKLSPYTRWSPRRLIWSEIDVSCLGYGLIKLPSTTIFFTTGIPVGKISDLYAHDFIEWTEILFEKT